MHSSGLFVVVIVCRLPLWPARSSFANEAVEPTCEADPKAHQENPRKAAKPTINPISEKGKGYNRNREIRGKGVVAGPI